MRAPVFLALWLALPVLPACSPRAPVTAPPSSPPPGPVAREWTWIPAGTNILGRLAGGTNAPGRTFATSGFWMQRLETRVSAYAEYLRVRRAPPPPGNSDLEVRDGLVFPKRGRARRPISGLTRDEAAQYAQWLSVRLGRNVTLPSADEWEYAARGGIRGAPYPWGWGDPARRARFAAASAAEGGGRAPNPFGLYDMAGNVFEWCADPGERVPACGGSWAEKNAAFLEVSRRVDFAPDYRGADVGFRLVVRTPAGSPAPVPAQPDGPP